ncbi:MAG: membrane protein insertion efficiency factor YidD [Oscillospiraceae bacterium]|nr:membrane protein insertion efficiency factor YidD [Oscillospiraceae bacterium]MBQ4102433.1 membrane protein insertion efficiency factor YidD [Oscillospiraceae bacterium]
MRKICLALIRFYQKNLSPLKKHGSCRFLPTCSEYAYLSISRFGVIKGGYLATCRLLRCHPLCPGGFDPVPKTFAWRKKNRTY